ncbi:hypothetical protein [Amycolatopsis sp. H20-H5]|uniref:hypothetical protein n=1 Tax=Amycolatopsis sp. H20-H5 TaxID=3046309 RepID=UPI002DBC027B|nr:hypothetical protein [Amycolatopsis sp. H20-H5]MEC3975081.1 hypothetical protein [Amycolatopsis sp. H20-H5]
MNAADIASLLAAGTAAPTGPEDIATYTGRIVTWDELSGVNTVEVNGVILSNLRVIQSGIGVAYQPDDVVMVVRKQTQYFIWGKVGAPGAGAANQIRSGLVVAEESQSDTAGGYVDLPSYGPELRDVYIGSSRRCLVLVKAAVHVTNCTAIANFRVTGASTVSPNAASSAYLGAPEATMSASSQLLLTAADGLNQGLHTFTMKYRVDSGTGGFANRVLTVIPF